MGRHAKEAETYHSGKLRGMSDVGPEGFSLTPR